MADRLGTSRRRVETAVATAAALAIGLSGCFGGAVDPSVQFSPVEAPLGEELSASLQGVLDQAVALSG